QLDACYERESTWEVMQRLQATIRACSLPREPFLRLIEANRMDQRVTAYETWADLKHYCVHSADPVGRLVLGVLGRGDHAAAGARVARGGVAAMAALERAAWDIFTGRPRPSRARLALAAIR